MLPSLKHTFPYCLLFCVVIACSTAPKTEGVWTVAYIIDVNGGKSHLGQKTLYDFEGDSLNIVHVGNQQTGEIEDIRIVEKCFLQKKPWRYTFVSEDSSEFILSHVSEDSIVLSASYYPVQLVLKPLPENLNKPYTQADLISKVFKSEVPGISHRIDFIDSTYMINTLGDYSEKIRWSLVNYKGHQFLNTNSFYLLQTLNSETNGKIILTNQYVATNANTYVQIKPKYKKEELYGNWLINNGEPLTYTPTGRKKKMGLSIDAENIMTHRKIIDPGTSGWQLSNDGQYIYQTDGVILYRIIDLTDSTLVLKDIKTLSFLEEISEETLKILSTNFVTKYIRGSFD